MSQAPAAALAASRTYHPLEIIPFFRRIPCSFGRNFIYTFIWSCLFGLAFYLVSAMFAGRLLSMHVFAIQILIANLVGYAIHGLFAVGEVVGLDAAAHRGGFVARVAYYTVVPALGVAFGFFAASILIDAGFRTLFTRPAVLMSMVTTSLAISIVLSVIFFWRERAAVAEAEVARERARFEGIEREAALANLRALQAQIEPHFLFNTLANVSSLVDPDPARAKHMLESFIRFLRASLNATRMASTTLAAEGELIGAYLDVLQVRMGDRLRYRIEVEPGLAAFELPPMLLQPVVENAIRHGLEPKVEGGEIAVRATREGSIVAIEVRDSGVGFAPVTRGGVGLANLRGRLKLLYGERASLTIAEGARAGAVVTLKLPA